MSRSDEPVVENPYGEPESFTNTPASGYSVVENHSPYGGTRIEANSFEEIVSMGRSVLEDEAVALKRMRDRLGASFTEAVRFLLECRGKVVVTGMGKSGAVGRKIAGTLSSTGTTSVFLHPAEGIHGDLGIITAQDVVLALSQSGETDELLGILPIIRRIGPPIVAMTGSPGSTLASYASAVLDTSVEREACPLNLAPTSSTTCQIAMGDALALCVMRLRRFTADDYALYHPGGALGRRLVLRASDLMRSGDQMAVVTRTACVKDVLFAITKARAGAAVMIDDDGRLMGILTDGDIRRALLRGDDVLSDPADTALTRHPTTAAPDMLAVEVMIRIDERAQTTGAQIGELPVVDKDNRPIGMLLLKDMIRAGIVP